MVTNPSRNSTEGRSLGAVIINLQRTPLDGAATLRVFGECDAVLAQLLAALGLPPAAVPPPPQLGGVSRALVPYDAEGRRVAGPGPRLMWLDLSPGQRVRLSPDTNRMVRLRHGATCLQNFCFCYIFPSGGRPSAGVPGVYGGVRGQVRRGPRRVVPQHRGSLHPARGLVAGGRAEG